MTNFLEKNIDNENYQRLNLRPKTLNKTIFKLAAPAILENFMFSILFFSDTVIIGWLKNEEFLAGIALGGLILFLANAPVQALSIATVSIVSRSWGERNFKDARKFAGHSLTITFAIALATIAVCYPLAEKIITFLGATGNVITHGAEYLRIVLLSSILGLPLMVSNGVIRAKGDTFTPMRISLAMNVINIALSIVLAFGIGPFPELKLQGVAWGTVIARTLGGLASLTILVSEKRGIAIRPTHFIHLRRKPLARILRLALPAMTERVLNSAAYLFFMKIVALLGTTVLAAHELAINVESLAFMPAFGLSIAVTTIIGQAIGAGRPIIAEVTVKRTMLFCVSFMLSLAVIFVLFAPWGVAVFKATPPVLKLAGLALQVSALELPFLAITFILMGALRGAGDTKTPMFVNTLSTIFLRLPATYLFAIIFKWGIAGVWLATALDWAARALGLWLAYRTGLWKLIHKKEKEKYL